MAKVTFLLYNPAADKPTPIIASVTFDGQRHKVYVGLSILPKQWDKKEQKALTRGYSHTNNGKLNDTLENTSERLMKCYDDHRAVGTLPSLATLKKVAEPVEAEPLPEADRLRVTEGTLRPLANQKLNGHLKELARLAEIDAPTERVRYAGGQRRATTAPKYEFVTTHTARRTFVTLALEAGVRPEVVMRITGHKSLSAFRRYVNVTEDTMLDEFSRAFA